MAISDSKRRLLLEALAGQAKGLSERQPVITPRAPGSPAPLTPEQRQIWLHASLSPDLPLYNEACTIVRKGPLDAAALKWSLNEFVRRHEIWRTSFEVIGGEVMQKVHPVVDAPIVVTDLSHLPPESREAEARRLAAADARKPFDLSRPPLLRARLATFGPDDHRLYLTLHHLIFDGVAVDRVLLPELLAIYEAHLAGKPADLPAPALQFGDYAVWRAAQSQERQLRGQLDYWCDELAGGPPDLELPTDKPRPRMPSHAGAVESAVFPPALVERLHALARREGATLYAVLLAGLTALLHRYSGQEDFAVGGGVDVRTRPELQKVMGCFVNSVALRVRPQGQLTFSQYVAHCRNVVVGALNAREAPFGEVVRLMQPHREAGRHPLFQVMFVLEPPSTPPAGWDVLPTDIGLQAAKMDIAISCEERPEGLAVRMQYSAELFEPNTIRQLIQHLQTVLAAAAADPGLQLEDLPLMSEAQVAQVLAMSRGAVHPVPEMTMVDGFTAQAAQRPDEVAVVAGAESWTYRQLDRRATQLACALRDLGVGPEKLVGVFMHRTPEMIAALIAVGRAGGAYLPLDPGFPAERLAVILEEAQPSVILTQRSLEALAPDSPAARLLSEEVPLTAKPAPAWPKVDPDSLACVLYTSGSTGRPKGVEINHRSYVNSALSTRREMAFGPGSRMLAASTLTFDISTLEIFLPLMAGGCVVLADRETARDPLRLARVIEEGGCDLIFATPASWRALLDAGWSGRPDLTLMSGGEVLTPDLARALSTRCRELWNIYGPTEATVYCTRERVGGDLERVSVGTPAENDAVYVLDARGRLLPPGIPGELFVGGLGVARGYRGRPDLTAERFGEQPGLPGQRLYRTGDKARWRVDGHLEWLGRLDNQVKVRGNRLELEEVEKALGSHPGVGEAAARVVEAAGETTLVGYVRPRGEAPETAELRAFLRRKLPDYMVPSHLIVVEQMPMTPTGKIDRKALPHPQLVAHAREVQTASSPVEAAIAKIWEEVLDRSPIGVDENFFDLGGHSLLVAKLMRRIEETFGRKLGMAAIFDAPDIRSMAALLEDGRAIPRTVNIQPHGSRPRLFWIDGGPAFRPLSHALGPDQPFLGVELEEDDDPQLTGEFTLADVARGIVDAITTAQPNGPYYIGGFCASGVVAHQVALQLIAAGHEVPLLCMVHSPFPPVSRRVPDWQIELSKAKQHIVESFRLGGRRGVGYAVQRIRSSLQKMRDKPPPTTDFRRRFYRTFHSYDPARYPGAVAFIQPIERPGIMDHAPHWRTTIDGPFESYDAPGDHMTILDYPNVLRVGEILTECLANAQARREASRGAAA